MDTSSPSSMLRALLPKVPLIFTTALAHTLWLSPTSTKVDLKTELIVRLIRSFMNSPSPTPISKQQAWSLNDPGIKGKIWISKVNIPPPEEDDIRAVLVHAVESMKEDGEIYTRPEIEPVEAEWTGYRSGVDARRPRLDLSEEQHYAKLMGEVSSDVTILYFHGGAFYLMDPSSHRIPTSRLAQLTGGRCLSVRYRLSPKYAFPCALLDALMAYLYLLYPPPGSFHSPVPASHVVIAGDSAGGNLSLSLLQLILEIRRSSPTRPPTIGFHGQTVPIPIPAGVAVNSAWLDMTRCMPSVVKNATYDYLPPPLTNDHIAQLPRCEIWPTDPPRGDLYCDISMLCHPLVSPLAAKDWSGACPLWLDYGQEMLVDEGKAVAALARKQGVVVDWQEWEAMPHCWSMIFEGLPAAKKAFASWAKFCGDAVGSAESIRTRGKFVKAKSLKEHEVDVEALGEFGREKVLEMMQEARRKREIGEEGEAKLLPRL